MRLRSVILASSSMLVLLAAAPAAAQTTGTQTGSATSPADAQNAPAGGTPAAAQDAAVADAQAATDDAATSGGEIVVTGLRQSLQSAQNIKRNSLQQVDSIVAQDIGKLPDIAVSDTAARIPGVQVERSGGEASRVLVRGLPDFNTTYNGRDIFTAESRSVALQDFPAGNIAALEVFKTTTAELVEGGLAGEVNVRSRKPFDFDGLEIAGSLWGQYEKRSKHKDPNGNLLISDRWDTGIGEIGALINFSYTRLRYLDSSRSNTDYVANLGVGPSGSNVRIPDIQRIDYGVGDRTRPSLNGALQWRPTPGLEIYGEALWQGFRNKVQDRELSVPLWGGAAYSDVVTESGGANPRVESLTVTNPTRPDGFQGATYGKTDTYQYAGGAKYDGGPLKISADLARTRSRFTNSVYSMDFAYAAPLTVSAVTGLTGWKDGPAFTFAGDFDPTDASNYVYRGLFDRRQVAKGDDWQVRADVSYETGVEALKSLQAGFRYVDRDASYTEGSRYNPREGDRLPFSAIPVDYHVFHSAFPDDDPTSVRGYLVPTYDSIRDNIDELRTFSGFAQGVPATDPRLTFETNEKSYAGYWQVNYQLGNTDGLYVDGALGLRVVNTDLQIAGISPETDTFTIYHQNYTDWLPNLSARAHFTDRLQLRLSYTQTRTRPSFGQYNPGTFLNPQQQGGAVPNGDRGNPNLRPFRSKNYDASLEWYFARASFISGAVFERDITGFIQNTALDITTSTGATARISQPFNTRNGRIKGAELQGTTFLDAFGASSWLAAFGVQANLTYLDTRTSLPGASGVPAGTANEILGVSKWSYNLAGFYEKSGLSLRLSYNYRSHYLTRIEARDANPTNTYSETVRPIGRLDFSGSYDLTKNLTVTADATNILAKPFISDLTYAFAGGTDPVTFPRIIRYEESVYSLGVRFRF